MPEGHWRLGKEGMIRVEVNAADQNYGALGQCLTLKELLAAQE